MLTPGFASDMAFPELDVAAVFWLAVATSRNELPTTALLPTRRPLPFNTLLVVAPALSLVLDASDLESSGGGRDLGGAIWEEL